MPGSMGDVRMMKPSSDQVVVFILAFNEEASIGALVCETRAKLPDATIVVVDDGSVDATAARASAAGAWVLRHPFNLGVAASEATGLKYAKRGGHRIAVRLDGDGQHDPAFVSELVAQLSHADLVVGARSQDAKGYRATGLRLIGARYLAFVTRLLSGSRITDVTSGFRAFGPAAIAYFSEHVPNDYPEPESIVMAARAGLRVTEVPVLMRRRETGASSLTFLRSMYYMAKVSFALVLETLRAPTRT